MKDTRLELRSPQWGTNSLRLDIVVRIQDDKCQTNWDSRIKFSKGRITQNLEQQKEGKMKRIFTFIIILMALTACTALQVQTPEPAATDMPQVDMPNPASVYCEQNGNKLEIRTAADGSQNGICVFPDGSTCDEWAYYRGECGPAAQKSPTPAMTVEATTEASGGGTRRTMPQAVTCHPVPQKR